MRNPASSSCRRTFVSSRIVESKKGKDRAPRKIYAGSCRGSSWGSCRAASCCRRATISDVRAVSFLSRFATVPLVTAISSVNCRTFSSMLWMYAHKPVSPAAKRLLALSTLPAPPVVGPLVAAPLADFPWAADAGADVPVEFDCGAPSCLVASVGGY